MSTILLEKNGIVSVLGNIDRLVIKYDPREEKPIGMQFNTLEQAKFQMKEALTVSLARGWKIIFRGQPNFG